MKIGRYETQIIKRLKYHLHIDGWHKLPQCSWYYPIDGWSCDTKDILTGLSEDFDIKMEEK